MIYNVSSVRTLVLEASVVARDVALLIRKYNKDLPEHHFLKALDVPAFDSIESGEPHRQIPIKTFEWSGTWSGNSIETLKEIASYIHGRIDAVLTWEGGDYVSGLRIQDGEYTECDVQMTLVPRKTEND
jgi:hypothetical protein